MCFAVGNSLRTGVISSMVFIMSSATELSSRKFPPMVPATSLRLRKRVRNCMVLLDSAAERMEALAA